MLGGLSGHSGSLLVVFSFFFLLPSPQYHLVFCPPTFHMGYLRSKENSPHRKAAGRFYPTKCLKSSRVLFEAMLGRRRKNLPGPF
ncbi:hypothetical protein F4820DRAFT_403190 [Hypoxylon rubiginosum]|uniref:Uncharacterized protein n=1 Tax=Hypoxylon rubiginosum TaxID=110542 RepID=A0ACB9ZGE6_9PEZI|nr:hypothetical protein F4820DRAFT_403190 [Hypoxylon rubiginosum]